LMASIQIFAIASMVSSHLKKSAAMATLLSYFKDKL
jgi:hypothetical protein